MKKPKTKVKTDKKPAGKVAEKAVVPPMKKGGSKKSC